MKTLKYRSAFAGLMVAALSVFLFTACEKDSDGGEPASKPSVLDKFQRVTFNSGSTSTSTSSTSSGTFTGGGGSISYAPPGGGSNSTFTPAESDGPAFTDPMTKGNSFDLNGGLGIGGGSLNIDGDDLDIVFGLCADEIFFSNFNAPDTNNVSLFLGIAGEDLDEGDLETVFTREEGLAFIYVLSYNGGTELGDFSTFEDQDGEVGEAAFVLVVVLNGPDENGDPQSADFWFATKGSATFAGTNIFLSGIELTKADGSTGLSSETVPMSGSLNCVAFELED